jgi:hypothetical protein
MAAGSVYTAAGAVQRNRMVDNGSSTARSTW